MRNIALIILCAILTACTATRDENIMTVAGFDIEKGQHMHDFFDEYEEPMRAKYIGNNISKWTYLIDESEDKNKIVRYCELKNYNINELCRLNVEFKGKTLTTAYTTCYQ